MSADYLDWEPYVPPMQVVTTEVQQRLEVNEPHGQVWLDVEVSLVPPGQVERPAGCDEPSRDVSFNKSLYACLFCDAVVRHNDLGSTQKNTRRARSTLAGKPCRDVIASLRAH